MFKNLSLFLVLLLFSCSVEQLYVFNKDFSGQHTFKLNLKKLSSLNLNNSDSFTSFNSFNHDSIAQYLNGLEGISNANSSFNNYVYTFSYNFNSLGALNQRSTHTSGDKLLQTLLGNAHFTSNHKKQLLLKVNTDSLDLDSLSMYFSFMTYNIVMEMPHKIKKVENPDARFINKKTIQLKGNAADLMQKKKQLNTCVLLK